MKNRIITYISFLLLALTSSASAVNKMPFTHVPVGLHPAVEAIGKLGETAPLLQRAFGGGTIRLADSYGGDCHFEALWDSCTRTIAINKQVHKTLGLKIRDLLFELHNAAATDKFAHLDKLAEEGKINKERYVRATELIEYQNVKATVALLDLGIARKIFPPDCKWEILPNFDEHYKMQQLTGHAQMIAQSFDAFTPSRCHFTYTGTIAFLSPFSEEEKIAMTQYLWAKAALTHGTAIDKQAAERFFSEQRRTIAKQKRSPLKTRQAALLEAALSS
jgi:hypothetical protein